MLGSEEIAEPLAIGMQSLKMEILTFDYLSIDRTILTSNFTAQNWIRAKEGGVEKTIFDNAIFHTDRKVN